MNYSFCICKIYTDSRLDTFSSDGVGGAAVPISAPTVQQVQALLHGEEVPGRRGEDSPQLVHTRRGQLHPLQAPLGRLPDLLARQLCMYNRELLLFGGCLIFCLTETDFAICSIIIVQFTCHSYQTLVISPFFSFRNSQVYIPPELAAVPHSWD